MRRILFAGIASLAILIGTAIPAFAAGGPGSASQSLTGNVTIPAALTLTLSTSSFSISLNPGETGNTGTSPFAVMATVATNDPNGYVLVESLTSQFTNQTASNQVIPATSINPYVYSGAGVGGFAGNLASQVQVAQSAQVASGDQWGLAYQFNIPSTQEAGTYTGVINVTAIGS